MTLENETSDLPWGLIFFLLTVGIVGTMFLRAWMDYAK